MATDLGLLLLRLGAGASLFVLFGVPKLAGAATFLKTGQWSFVEFNTKVGLPAPVLIAFYQSLNESVGALLVALGAATRLAAGSLCVGFAGAAACSLKADEPVWLMAAYYSLMFGALALTGAGRFSVDAMRRARARGASAAAAFLAIVLASRPAPAQIQLHPCGTSGIDGARCGTLEVHENRKTGKGRTIGLNVLVLPALSATPAPDPVFWLHGGPGAAATQTAAAAKGGFLEGLRRDRDLVFVDQRGTGRSNPLDCDLGDDPADLDVFFGPLFPRDLVLRCRRKLEAIADLALYTTPIAMDDLDEVRAALGYERINLVAASYGTIAAQVYLRQHPDHVRSVFLLGVATPSIKQPLPFAKGAQHAMDLLFEDCAADETCRTAFPKLREEFEAVLARFNAGPLRIEALDLKDKKMRPVLLARDNFVERIRLLLYTTTFASFVPLIVDAAYRNDFLPFETLAVRYNPGGILARGMYLTVTCSEGVPFISSQDLRAETRDTWVGEERVLVHMRACKDWPRGAVEKSFTEPVRSGVPLLMFSGEVDGSTPPWFGASALRHLSGGVQVTARYYGHQLDSPCMWGVLDRFIAKGSARGLDASCAETIRRPPFATKIPPELAL